MTTTLATRYRVTRDPESACPALAGHRASIITRDAIDAEEYEVCVWGNGSQLEQQLNSASSVISYTEAGSVTADLKEIGEAITDDMYATWINTHPAYDSSPSRTTRAMVSDLCEEFVLNTIESAQGEVDVTADVLADIRQIDA